MNRADEIIEELTKVRPEMLTEDGLKLFNTIMAILDERDKLIKRNKELEEENKQLKQDVEGYSGLAKQIQEDYEKRIDELENRDRFE